MEMIKEMPFPLVPIEFQKKYGQISTLEEWGVWADETFFLGGMEKNRILEIFKPHMFFDDQMSHLQPSAGNLPMVHVPFGVANR